MTASVHERLIDERLEHLAISDGIVLTMLLCSASDISASAQFLPKILPRGAHAPIAAQGHVRAAFKAGIKPSLIARQFSISQSDVKKVLAFDAAVRVSQEQALACYSR
jgi:hypothetical protein